MSPHSNTNGNLGEESNSNLQLYGNDQFPINYSLNLTYKASIRLDVRRKTLLPKL